MRVQVVLFDGFDPLDVIGPFEVFSAAGMISGGAVEVELACAGEPREVPSGVPQISLRAKASLDPAAAGIIVVPGAAGSLPTESGLPSEDSIPVILGRTLETALPELLRKALGHADTTVATVCGGSLVLAMAGLIEGRPVTTNHLGLDLLDATGANAIDARVVDDGDLVTAAGVTSGLDLGLYLVERELGPQIAHAVEKLFAHERRGVVWRNTGAVPQVSVSPS